MRYQDIIVHIDDGDTMPGRLAVAATEMPQMHINTYSLAETFDVGRDTGTQVSKLYTDPFEFQGALDRVTIRLTGVTP